MSTVYLFFSTFKYVIFPVCIILNVIYSDFIRCLLFSFISQYYILLKALHFMLNNFFMFHFNFFPWIRTARLNRNITKPHYSFKLAFENAVLIISHQSIDNSFCKTLPMQLTAILLVQVSLLHGDSQGPGICSIAVQHSSLESSARECENKREMNKWKCKNKVLLM